MKILGKSFYLRPLLKKDLSEEYFSWLKDREVNQFLDVRFSVPDRKKAETNLEKYDNKKSFFFGVFDKKNDKFIGTTTLQIDTIYKIAYYGYLIGDKNYWGTNAGIDTIALLMDFGFDCECDDFRKDFRVVGEILRALLYAQMGIHHDVQMGLNTKKDPSS